MTGCIDLNAYLDRIEYDGPRRPMRAALEKLHLAHATRIPFENLDPLLGRPVRLDLESLQAKLVQGRRGGYCFEQNTLFAAALEAIGFRVTRLAARVRFGAAGVLPRTHMLLKVDVDGAAWLADVGFGGDGLLKPMPLAPGKSQRQFHWEYRVVEDAGLWVLQSQKGGAWVDFYAFTLEPQLPVDFEMANHYTSTHPSSIFVRALTVQRATSEGRYILRNRQFTVQRGDEESGRALEGDGDIRQVLRDPIGLDIPGELLATALRKLPPRIE